jgi:hypothetical protein
MLSFTPVLPLAPSIAFNAIIHMGVSTEIQVKNSTEITCTFSHNNSKWQSESRDFDDGYHSVLIHGLADVTTLFFGGGWQYQS